MNLVLNKKILIFLLAGVLIGIVGSKWYFQSKEHPSENSKAKGATAETVSNYSEPITTGDDKIPSKVYVILKYVETFHEPKDGYVGGRVFHNFEGLLPKQNTNGDKITYREWDVNPKQGIMKRGKERLITGDDNSAWYTNNHYKSFIKIR